MTIQRTQPDACPETAESNQAPFRALSDALTYPWSAEAISQLAGFFRLLIQIDDENEQRDSENACDRKGD